MEFTSEEGNFVVSLPTEPNEETRPDPDFEDIDIYVYMAQAEDKNAFFGVSYRDYPQEFIDLFDKDNIDVFFDSTSEEALSTMGGELISQEDISLDGFPGRRITYKIPETTLPGGGEGVTHSYLVGNRRYEVLSLGVTGDLAEEDIEQFFSSFRLLVEPKLAEADADAPADAAPDSSDWVEVSSAEGGFTALFPSKPSEQTQSVPSAMGDIKMQIFMAPLGTEAIFGVMYNDFPLDISTATGEDFEKIMDNGRDSALANMGGELISEEKVSLGDYSGRHIIFEIPENKLPGGGKGILRVYLVENRLYQLIALGSHEAISDEDIEFFINSFELTAP
jgi:predicted RNase H-like HicB family nuclease